jgi:hypothetical protein
LPNIYTARKNGPWSGSLMPAKTLYCGTPDRRHAAKADHCLASIEARCCAVALVTFGDDRMSKLQLLRWMPANHFPAVACWKLWVEIHTDLKFQE